MSENVTVKAGGGIGFAGLLGVAFIVLKLCHVIDWPWLWVLAPIWMPICAALGFFLVCLAIFIVVKIATSK